MLAKDDSARTARDPLETATPTKVQGVMERIGHSTLAPEDVATPISVLTIDYWSSIEAFFRPDQLAYRKSGYSPLRFEFLIASATGLLAKITAARGTYDALRQQCSELLLRTYQLTRMQEIHNEEVERGWYALDAEQADARNSAQVAMHHDASWRLEKTTEHMDRVFGSPFGSADCRRAYEEVDKMARSIQKRANASMISAYSQGGKKPDAKFNTKNLGAGETWLEGDDYKNREIVGYYSYIEAFLRASHQYSLASIAEENAKRSLEAQGALRDAAKKHATWESDNVSFRRQRSELATLLSRCLEYFRGPHGPMALEEQLNTMRERAAVDLADAFVRLEVADEGIRKLFDCADHIDDFPAHEELGSLPSIIDRLNHWTQRATQYLSVRMRQDQAFTLSLSVRELGGAMWNTANAGYVNNGRFSLKFWIDKDVFTTFRAVRSIGLTVSVESSSQSPRGTWRGSISLPSIALYVRDGGGEERVEQPKATVALGGLRNRGELPAALFGGGYIENHSPISWWDGSEFREIGSEWEIALELSSFADVRAPLDDVGLELIVFGHSVPASPSH